MTIPSFLTAILKTSVPMNGLYLPFDRCIANLQRFCRPVLFHNDDPTYEVSARGSSLLLRHQGRAFVLFSAHQLGIGAQRRRPDEAMLILTDGTSARTGRGPDSAILVRHHDANVGNLDDVILLEYMLPPDDPALMAHFYQIDFAACVMPSQINREAILAIFAIGYPTQFSRFEPGYDEAREESSLEVASGWCPLYLERTEPSVWDTPHRLPLQLHPSYRNAIGDPDGFSGAPVFLLHQDVAHQVQLAFVGMITHASHDGRFMVYDATHLREIVLGALDRQQYSAT